MRCEMLFIPDLISHHVGAGVWLSFLHLGEPVRPDGLRGGERDGWIHVCMCIGILLVRCHVSEKESRVCVCRSQSVPLRLTTWIPE
jgi:hypothetical protein